MSQVDSYLTETNTSGVLQKPLTTVTSETGQRVPPISCCGNTLYHHPLLCELKQKDFGSEREKNPTIKTATDMKVK